MGKPKWGKRAVDDLVARAGMSRAVAAALVELVAGHVAEDLRELADYFDRLAQDEMAIGIRSAALRLQIAGEAAAAVERLKTKGHKGWSIERASGVAVRRPDDPHPHAEATPHGPDG